MRCYLGIDVSKGYGDFTLLDENKIQLGKTFQLDDTRQGHTKLRAYLEGYSSDEVYCAVESTGGFENNWYASLVEMGKTMNVKVARLNPSGVKNNISAGLNRNVTDALSSKYIAEYLISHSEKAVYKEQSSYYSSFRSLHKHICLLKKQNTQLINEFKIVLYSAFPEILRYCKQSTPGWVLDVLERYPSPEKLKRVQVKTLVKIKHLTNEKAEAILHKSKNTVASRIDATQEFLIKGLSRQIKDKQALIKEHKLFLANECRGKETELLTSIPGIAEYSAAAIMVEIENIHRFASPKNLVSYFGVHPQLKDSGDKKGVHRMSKKGRASMRGTLYMCASSAVLCDEHLKSNYHNHRSKGMNHKQAIGVIMQKLLRLIWAILTTGKKYEQSIDKKNQEKKIEKDNAEEDREWIAKRRFQSLDSEAPISRRQTRKRKAHLESQVPEREQVRDHQNAPMQS